MKWKKFEFKCEAEECQEQIFANNDISVGRTGA